MRLTRSLLATTLGLASAAAVLTAAPAAQAKAAPNGDFSDVVNGTTYNPAVGKDVKLQNVALSGPILARGVNVTFDINPATLGVTNYTLTGALSADRMVTAPTVIFASKTPTLTAAQRAGVRLSQLEVKDDNLTVILTTAAGKMKFQAKDGATGGLFQMEPEFGSAVTVTHVLGPTVFYFVNPFTGKINFSNGLDPVALGPNAHQMLLGKDSPQVATKTSRTRRRPGGA